MYFIQENFALVLVWLLAIFISIVSFIAAHNIYPSFSEILLAHTLYAALALPNAFLHVINFYIDKAAHRDFFFFILAAAYWGGLVAAHYWYFEENREGKYVFVIALLVLPASIQWLIYGVALIKG